MSTFLQRTRASDPDKSAAWKLFNYRFNCKVKQIHMTPNWVFTDYGVLSSGNADIDREIMDANVDYLLTAMDMAIIAGRGVNIIISDPADCVAIYEIVSQHLSDWVDALENNPHINRGPIEDLQKFDILATIVWQIAKHYVKVEVGTTHLMQRLNSFYINPLGNRGAAKTNVQIDESHNSVSDDLVRLTARPKRAWESKPK